MAFFRRILGIPSGPAPAGFQPLSGAARGRVEALLSSEPVPTPPEALVSALDAGRGRFRASYERVLDEVRRRCAGAEIWQNFYLDLLDEEGSSNEGEEGVGADPVDADEELRRLLAGIALFPELRRGYAWELGYHCLRYALARSDPEMHHFVARAAIADYLTAFRESKDVEGRISTLGDVAGALAIADETELSRQLCDFAAAEISPVEAQRQELQVLRAEGPAFARKSYID